VNYREFVKYFNFREIEKIVKTTLIRSGYKPPIVDRKKINEEENFQMKWENEKELSEAC
jgi:hypothetical protein